MENEDINHTINCQKPYEINLNSLNITIIFISLEYHSTNRVIALLELYHCQPQLWLSDSLIVLHCSILLFL